MRMHTLPCERLLFRFEEAVDHERAAFASVTSAQPGGLAIDYRWPRVDSDTRSIGEINLTAVGDLFWVDRAVAGPQSFAIETSGGSPFARPIYSDPRQQRFFARRCLDHAKRQERADKHQFLEHGCPGSAWGSAFRQWNVRAGNLFTKGFVKSVFGGSQPDENFWKMSRPNS